MFSVVFIVKDEEHSLPEAIRSLGDVPEIVVCDTGSSDGTVSVAKQAGARVCHFRWSDDFSAARTFAASKATYDWIVRFDADERLVVDAAEDRAAWLRRALGRTLNDAAAMICVRREHAPGLVHWFPRCYRRSEWVWHYPVHELLRSRCSQRLPVVAAHGAMVTHQPVGRPRPYRRILERAVAAEHDDPHLTYYLGRTCYDEGDVVTALHRLGKYLSTTGGYQWHRSEAHLLRGRLFARRGEVAPALQELERAATVSGARAEPLLEAATLCAREGWVGQAKAYLARGRVIQVPQEMQMFGASDVPYVIDVAAYREEPWRVLEQAMATVRGR